MALSNQTTKHADAGIHPNSKALLTLIYARPDLPYTSLSR